LLGLDRGKKFGNEHCTGFNAGQEQATSDKQQATSPRKKNGKGEREEGEKQSYYAACFFFSLDFTAGGCGGNGYHSFASLARSSIFISNYFAGDIW
jgi:hypothetical protein